MSVSLLTKTQITKAMNTLSKNDEVKNFIKDSFEYGDHIKYGSESVESFIGRALWYGYIANITAWNVQYDENQQIDFTDFDDTLEFETLEEAISTLGSLLYNIYTNAGNCFLQDKWVNAISGIKKEFELIEEYETPSWCY